MEFLTSYGLFFVKTLTITLAIVAVLMVIAALKAHYRSQRSDEPELEIKKLNDRYDEMRETFECELYDKDELKKLAKARKKAEKQKQQADCPEKTRLFLLHFDGDMQASEAELLRDEVTAVLTIATPKDEIVVRLESEGGLVHSYGFASSQLQRIRDRQIPLTITIDHVAASGGYMMACVANQILAAPFAIVGSIGVVAQLPNFNRLLKKYDIDYEQITSGEYKRTLTMFGENTEKGREKFTQEIEDTHHLFKKFVGQNRPQVKLEEVATGEHWYGEQALGLNLVDKIITSDDYLLQRAGTADIYEVQYVYKEQLTDKLFNVVRFGIRRLMGKLFSNI